MRKIIFSLLTLFLLASTIEAQDKNPNKLSAELADGYPPMAESFIKTNKVEQAKQAQFITGVDSLKLTFGTFRLSKAPGYYLLFEHGKKYKFTASSWDKNDSSGLLEEKVEITLDNSSSKIAFQVWHDPKTDIIHYQWLDEEGSSKTAKIQKVDKPLAVNKMMPDFTSQTLSGKAVALPDYKGKYLVINWWATSCGPCVAEMPGLNKMVDKFKSRNDIEFIAIASDEKGRLEKFLKKREFKYLQTYNPALASLFGESYPKHIIVNPEGLITYYLEGGSEEIYLDIERSLSSQLKADEL